MLSKYKTILWDFDGVIMDSMPIRDKGFIEVLKDYPSEQVDRLIDYHQENGGLSRYVKFRYFFEVIRQESITEEQVQELAKKFSEIMLKLLCDDKLLIADSVRFISDNSERYEMHVVSGSDGKELNLICQTLGLTKFFKTINGSPTPKINLVASVLTDFKCNPEETVIIGDSKNDYDAAQANNIDFFGYNNKKVEPLSAFYIKSFDSLIN